MKHPLECAWCHLPIPPGENCVHNFVFTDDNFSAPAPIKRAHERYHIGCWNAMASNHPFYKPLTN